MIYSNEQAKLIKQKQKKVTEAAAERAEIKKALQEMNAWTMEDLGVEL